MNRREELQAAYNDAIERCRSAREQLVQHAMREIDEGLIAAIQAFAETISEHGSQSHAGREAFRALMSAKAEADHAFSVARGLDS